MPLSGRVLVLNQSYQPLSVCDIKKAIVLLYLQKAETVVPDKRRKIRSVSQSIDCPSVIKLRRYVRVPFIGIEISRKNVLKRDAYTCQYCGSGKSLTIDHVLPKSRGGEDSWENLVTACIRCNNKKGNRLPHEAGMPLSSQPRKPDYFMYLRSHFGFTNEEWKQFMYE